MDKSFKFYAVSDFSLFCNLTGADFMEFSDSQYKCLEGYDFCKSSLNWFLSKGIPEFAARHCISLEHGRPIRGCRVVRGGWIYIYYHKNNFIAFPYAETSGGLRIALFYDLTWLVRLPGVTSNEEGFSIDFVKDNDVIWLPNSSCMIPGSSNPSHFVEYFVKHEILATCKNLARYVPIKIELTGWQKTILRGFGTEYLTALQPLDNLKIFHPGAYHIQFNDGFIFEDVPQWLGLQHARRIIRQMNTALYDGPSTGIVYLCRARSELTNGSYDHHHRVKDFLDVSSRIGRVGGTIVFPEMHTPENVQKIIRSASVVIADPGSCNIHALWSPMISAHTSKYFYQLIPSGLFYVDTHDAARGFEWFCNLMGTRFSFVFGVSDDEDIYSGSVPIARYDRAIANVINKHS